MIICEHSISMSNIKLSRRKVISGFFCGEQAAFQNNTFLSGYKEIKFVCKTFLKTKSKITDK